VAEDKTRSGPGPANAPDPSTAPSQMLLDTLPHPTLLIDRDRIVLAANQFARDLGAHVGHPCWLELSPGIGPEEHAHHGASAPKDTPCPFCRIDEAFATKDTVHVGGVQGRGRVWDVYWVPLDHRRCLHYAIDATRHSTVEAELRRERDRAQQYLDIAGVIMVAVGADQTVQLINRRGCEILGYSEDEVLGRNWFDGFVPERMRETVRQAFDALIAGKLDLAEHFENPIRTRSGEERAILWRNTALRDPDGNITATLSSGLDITDRRRAEQDLRETVRELERSNEDLDQFAAIVAHDLQQPLLAIAGFAQLLQRRYHGKLDDNADRFIDRLVNRTERMAALIQDVLTYSRVGTGGSTFQPVPCSIVFQQVVDLLRDHLEPAQATVSAGPLPVVFADRSQIAQLFQNLLGNAARFRSEEPLAVRVEAAREDTHWHFCVTDNGIGIAPDNLDQIFVMFRRLHKSTEYPGTGVGLAIAKKIVERHGGRIWATSQPGEGATFHFTLPCSDELWQDDPPPQSADAPTDA